MDGFSGGPGWGSSPLPPEIGVNPTYIGEEKEEEKEEEEEGKEKGEEEK
jgi:hypothetical protein